MLEEDDRFGPGHCVSLARSQAGSCVVRTRCKSHNISDTDFAFVCVNQGHSMPHALHSFGRGGFKAEELFDTKVHCQRCTSVDTAFRTGSPMVRNALAALPLSRLPSLAGHGTTTSGHSPAELASYKPTNAAVYGPSYCISAFLAPGGTCLIRTKCADVDLSKFNIGVTCLDKSGGYTRYLFGKDTFKPEETFDTLVSCEKCLGVGPESSVFAMHALMPRKLVEDVGTLKTDVQTLHEKVRVLQESGAAPAPGTPRKKGSLVEEEETPIPTIMLSRGGAGEPGAPGAAAEAPDAGSLATGGAAAPAAIDTSSSVAVPDLAPLEVVNHRKGAAIAELFRRAGQE